MQEKLGCAVM